MLDLELAASNPLLNPSVKEPCGAGVPPARAGGVPAPQKGRAAEVPFFALFDPSIFCKPMRRLGQTMLKVAPLGDRALKGGFTRTPEKVTPLPYKRFLRSLPASPSATP